MPRWFLYLHGRRIWWLPFFCWCDCKAFDFKCKGGEDSFSLTIQSVNFGGGLGGGLQSPMGIVSGCNKKDVIANITGWGIFANVFPPGIPTEPGLGLGVDVSTSQVTGRGAGGVPSAGIAPGYGLEVSAGGSYSWIVE